MTRTVTGGVAGARGLLCALVVVTLTACGAMSSGGDDVARSLAREMSGSRTTADDILAAARRAPGELPRTATFGEDAFRLSSVIANDYNDLATGFACDAFDANLRVSAVPAVQALLDRIWAVVDADPGAAQLVRFSCLLNEWKGAAEGL